ncbi:MAG: hypothetical protein ABEK59_02695 [Halobacteria archaeon]
MSNADNGKIKIDDENIDEGCASTGVPGIDELTGGVKKGSIVSVVSHPLVASDMLLKQLAYNGRETRYLTAYQEPDSFRDEVENHADGDPKFDEESRSWVTDMPDKVSGTPLDTWQDDVENQPIDVVLEQFDVLVERLNEFSDFIFNSRSMFEDTDSVLYLHLNTGMGDFDAKQEVMLYVSDSVLVIDQDEDRNPFLSVAKLKAKESRVETKDLEISDQVELRENPV